MTPRPEVLFEASRPAGSPPPDLSLVLLDWSVRESLHLLDYLRRQTRPRATYEVIWIEYYGRRHPDLEARLARRGADEPADVDKWIVLGMPDDVYYHKHLMYNVGLLAAAGRIVAFMDSDAFVRETFVGAIVRRFEREPGIVLHLDEVRSLDRRFYPFGFPSFEEFAASPCANAEGGRPFWVLEPCAEDLLHMRNYGACMCALREDLIRIGGADEHIDYLGHICGPYEMTWRLENLGRREEWEEEEVLYHAWHPGQTGRGNYMGPHDGRHLSSTALEARRSGRVLPLVENRAVREAREGRGAPWPAALARAIPAAEIPRWTYETAGWPALRSGLDGVVAGVRDWASAGPARRALLSYPARAIRHPVRFVHRAGCVLLAAEAVLRMLGRQTVEKTRIYPRERLAALRTSGGALRKALAVASFLRRTAARDAALARRCRETVGGLRDRNVCTISIYGTGDVARLLRAAARDLRVRVLRLYDDAGGGPAGVRVLPPEEAAASKEKILIATVGDPEERAERLRRLGVAEHRIATLRPPRRSVPRGRSTDAGRGPAAPGRGGSGRPVRRPGSFPSPRP